MRILFSLSILAISNFVLAQSPINKIGADAQVASLALESSGTKVINAQDVFISEKKFLDVDNNPTAVLQDVQTKIISASIDRNVELPTAFTATVHKGYEQKKPMVFVQIPRYIKTTDGQIQQLISYNLQLINGAPIKQTRGTRVYAANSVLANGNFYKIAITNEGLHKIDFNFVKDKLGIEPATINPTKIGLFGNGGTMVPENNAIPRADDLTENAIELVGMQDGSFDANDYILFYGTSPFSILKDSINKVFTQTINIYSNQTKYFFTVTNGTGKRVVTSAFTATPNTTVTSFNDFQFVHIDSSILTKSANFGKRWWGDQFGVRSKNGVTKYYNFSFPDIIKTEPVKIKIELGNVGNITSSQFTALANGTALGSVFLDPVGTDYNAPVYSAKAIKNNFTTNVDDIGLQLNYFSTDDGAFGYLDHIEINARRQLIKSAAQLSFSDFNSVAPSAIAQFTIGNASTAAVWDVTNPLLPTKVNTISSGTDLQFVNDASTLKKYVTFSGSDFFAPKFVEKIPAQNLHALPAADYLIIAHPNFLQQANELAAHHTRKRNLRVIVTPTTQIYNEFSCGSADISGIRDFIKMFYDKAVNANDLPQNVLLFGDASYDYKDRIVSNTNYVPTRETDESASKINGYCSDDFFGFLDDAENITNANIPNTLDVGLGRLTASDAQEAEIFVYKIKMYDSSISFGNWRNTLTFCADNKDYGTHADDAEYMAVTANNSAPYFNNYKVFVDAFPVYNSPGGDRSPQAKQALDAQIYNGSLLVNYNGHGGPTAWCDERIFTIADIPTYTNITKLPLYITATCDFGEYDQPELKTAAEKLLNYEKGGAIALMTTTQLVFAYQNKQINSDYMKVAFNKLPNGKMPSFGDAFRQCKNKTYAPNTQDLGNFRKFVLLGDPALQMAFPTLQVAADSLNGVALSQVHDTLKALNVYELKGSVLNVDGTLASNFSGNADITIFDKLKNLTTLGNGNNSTNPKVPYTLQNSTICKNKVSVQNGKWTLKFVVPKDINYNYGAGKISMYANNTTIDGQGFDNRVIIGGTGNNNVNDATGPQINGFMNNTKFINGGIVNKNSTLLIDLKDDNGINTAGSGIGHDITATLDGNANETVILNNFYEGEKDNYKAGTVRYPYKGLTTGKHTLHIKAWDVLNNSSETDVDFVVADQTAPLIDKLYNIPNPFTTFTEFTFEHNYPGEVLYVTVQIFSVSGQMVRSIRKVVAQEGSRVTDIAWDGKDENGDPIGKGVYLYKLYYKTQSGFSASKYQKLIKL